MGIKKNFFAPLFKGLGATRRAAMLLLVMMLTTATAWATDKTLSGSESYTANDGDVLTGSTSGTVTIANNAKITLSDVTITGGIVCEGSAEITLVGTNSVTGASQKAGIQVGGSGTTFTIKGNGSLTANGGSQSAGIGLSRAWDVDAMGGDIVIEGGNITATGDNYGAGIGTGVSYGNGTDNTATIGNITIKGGTVRAIGGTDNSYPGNGIGKGGAYSCGHAVVGTITIYDGIDMVDASSISDFANVVYMYGETNVTANKTDYFTIIEDGNRRVIVPKDNTDYTITIANGIEHGTLTGAATAKYMEEVTITATPALGYRFSRLVVKDAQNNDVASTGNSFFMPKSNVTVSAVFEQGTHGTTEFALSHYSLDVQGQVTDAIIYDGITTVNMNKNVRYNIIRYDGEYNYSEFNYSKFWLDNNPLNVNIPYAGGTGIFQTNATNFSLGNEAPAGYYDITMTEADNGKWNVSILKTAGQMDVVPDQTYTGSEIKPEPLVMAGSLNLTKGTDYEYSYENNTDAGTATVRATFKGTYASLGYVEKEFKIVYPTVTTSYVEADGTLHENVVAIPLINTMTTLAAGTYVVNSDVAYTSGITTTGDVTLILGDGCTMSFGTEGEPLYATIMECNSNNLTIYGQSGGTGWLKAYSDTELGINAVYAYTQYSGNVLIRDYKGACINAVNSVTLLGGTLDVESGGNPQGDISGGTISILGGKLWAREKGLYSSQGITLGYTNATDQIYVQIYHAYGTGLQIADGKTLVDDYGVIWSGALDNDQIEHGINNRTLKPVMGVTLTKDGSGNISAEFDGTSTTTVSIPVDINVTSVTYNRTFTDGRPSTVMLPFSLGEGQTLIGGKLYKFQGVIHNDNCPWEAILEETATLQANTPYLLMPDGKVTFDLNNSTVTLNTNGGGNRVTADEGSHWTFKGTYEYMKWTNVTSDPDYNADREAEIGRAYGFAGVAKDGLSLGDFVRVANGAKIRPMSCYLLWNDIANSANARSFTRGAAATDEELPQRITVRLVGSNGETTAIGTLDTKTGEMTFFDEQSGKAERDSEAWYTLDGVRLSGKPTQKGLYINNGRKVVIK